jgi:hypothetical protein
MVVCFHWSCVELSLGHFESQSVEFVLKGDKLGTMPVDALNARHTQVRTELEKGKRQPLAQHARLPCL